MLTLGQAAAQAGSSKTTLRRAIQTGRLSAARLEDGSYRIDASELGRYLDAQGAQAPSEAVTVTSQERGAPRHPSFPEAVTPDTLTRLAVVEALLTEMRERLREVQSERDAWRAQAERLALPRVADQPQTSEAGRSQAQPEPIPERRGFWRRMFG